MAIQGAWVGNDCWWQGDHIDEGPVGGDRSLQIVRKQAEDYGTQSRFLGNNSLWSDLTRSAQEIGRLDLGQLEIRT